MTARTMERFKASSMDEGCRGDSPTRPCRRRQTLVGRGVVREDSARGTGLLGTIRRMSVLDPMQLHQFEQQARGDDISGNNDNVHDYHEVFQNMKQAYPTSASGALHQKTMARMAELKSAREHEEELERIREEEERLQKMPMASKAFKAWVGKIGRSSNVSTQQDPHDQDNDSPHYHSSYVVQQHHHIREEFNNSSDRLLPNFIGSRPSILMRNFQDNRRISMDSGMMSGTSKSTHTHITDEVNLARRMSVASLANSTTDLDEMNQFDDDAKSVLSLLSDVSGLFVDDREDSVSKMLGADNEDDGEDSQNLSLQLLKFSIKPGGNPQREEDEPESKSRSRRRGVGDAVIVVGQPNQTSEGGEDDTINGRPVAEQCITNDAGEARSTLSSMAYDSMSDSSGRSSSGLIVGFSNRRTTIKDSGDDLIVGFVNRSECSRKS